MDGILAIDKNPGFTSRDVCNVVQRITGDKCGHSGTLDPSATGLLLVGLGKGPRVFELISDLPKTYYFEVIFGKETDTLDATGKVVSESSYSFNEAELLERIKSFRGIIEQEVPLYSAQKVNGERLYNYARKNVEVKLPRKRIRVHKFELIGYEPPCARLEIECSKGTYVRSIARDLGHKLDTVAHAKMVRRSKIGHFTVETALKQGDINGNTIGSHLIPIDKALEFIPSVTIDSNNYKRFVNGSVLRLGHDSEFVRVYFDNRFLGVSRGLDSRYSKPHKVLYR